MTAGALLAVKCRRRLRRTGWRCVEGPTATIQIFPQEATCVIAGHTNALSRKQSIPPFRAVVRRLYVRPMLSLGWCSPIHSDDVTLTGEALAATTSSRRLQNVASKRGFRNPRPVVIRLIHWVATLQVLPLITGVSLTLAQPLSATRGAGVSQNIRG